MRRVAGGVGSAVSGGRVRPPRRAAVAGQRGTPSRAAPAVTSGELPGLDMTDSAAFLSTQFLPTFIDAYRAHECLWMVKSKDYSNRAVKAEAYQDLTQLTRTIIPECDSSYVKRKIEILRGSFRREYRKVHESLRGGGGVYAPKLWYYHLLLFLKDQEDSKRPVDLDSLIHMKLETVGALALEDDDDNEDATLEAEPELLTAPSPLYGLQKRARYEDQARVPEDEYDKFAAVVASKLRKMSAVQELFAENLINQVLFNGLMGRLQEDSVVHHS